MTTIFKIAVAALLASATIAAYGGCFYGWFLPDPLKTPVSLRDGSVGARGHGHGYYFFGRTHYGGGYGSGK